MIAAAAYVVAFPVYNFIDAWITGGVHHDGDLLVVDLQAMSDFELDQINGKTEDIPMRYRNLDGKRVELAGEMWTPRNAAGPVNAFVLVYSINNCCFSGPPRVQHLVHASMPKGVLVQRHGGTIRVIGVLHVGVERAEGRIKSVYRLVVEQADPK